MSAPHRSSRLLRVAAVVAACAVGSAAQETWLEAPVLDDVWAGRDGRLCAQAGRRIVVFDAAAARPTVVRDAVVPEGAFAFDDDGFELGALVGGALRLPRADGGGASTPLAGSPWDAPEGPPLRTPLRLADGRWIAAGRGGVAAFDPSRGTTTPTFDEVRRRRSSTYGLGGVVVDASAAPHVFALDDAAPAALLVGRDGAYAVVDAAGGRRALAATDANEGSGVSEFDVRVPPLLARFGRDGTPTFLRTDPGAGVVVVQPLPPSGILPPPRPILLGGPCVAAAVDDVTGDGAPDLRVVRLPPLTPAQQLAILVEGRVRATVLVYQGGAEGIGATPTSQAAATLGVAVTVRDGDRRAAVTTLVGATADGRVLTAEPGAPALATRFDDPNDVKKLGVVPAGTWRRPLRPVRVGRRLAAILRTPAGDRLVVF